MLTAQKIKRFVITHGDEQPPADAVLIYEGEWNEEASPLDHLAAIHYFSQKKGVRMPTNLPDIAEDDAVWFIP